jgi:hypothetical protein
MAFTLATLLIALQDVEPTTEPTNWWTSMTVGEWVGKDWLLMVGGLIFFGVISYAIYSAMIYNMVGNNHHPANFRRAVLALFLLFSIIWFIWVFAHAFGGLMAIILLVAWIVLALVLAFTRRKVAQAQG